MAEVADGLVPALQARGIAAVRNDRASVFAAGIAPEFADLLGGCLDPRGEYALRRAAATRLVGVPVEAIEAVIGPVGRPLPPQAVAAGLRSPGMMLSHYAPNLRLRLEAWEVGADEALLANLASLRDLLAGGVVLTTQRLQEAVDEAVERGRITRRDAEELAGGLLSAGRQQTQDLVAELEQLLGRGRSDLSSARSITRGAVKGSSERVMREVDRARRAAGMGPSFPIIGYDDLTAAQVVARLGELTPAELRKVRSHEKHNAKRGSIMKAVKKTLG